MKQTPPKIMALAQAHAQRRAALPAYKLIVWEPNPQSDSAQRHNFVCQRGRAVRGATIRGAATLHCDDLLAHLLPHEKAWAKAKRTLMSTTCPKCRTPDHEVRQSGRDFYVLCCKTLQPVTKLLDSRAKRPG